MKQFIYPYIVIRECKEAADYYKDIFDGEIIYQMLGKDTPNCPEGFEDKIMHLQLKVKDHQIYMAEEQLVVSDAIQLHLDYQDPKEMEVHFDKMRQIGSVQQELGETFWGAVFGVIKDKFGVTWQFHHSLPRE